MSNNFDSLILMLVFGIKYLLFKLFLKGLKIGSPSFKSLKIQLFLSKFSRELICFTPFIAISALSTFYYLGETNALGKVNNLLQILAFFCIILVPCMAIVKLKPTNIIARGKRRYKYKNRFEKVIQIFLNLLIPGLVVINNNKSFFILISMVIVWKFVNFFRNIKAYNRLEKIIKTITNFSWLIYHLSFLTFYVFDHI